MKRISANRTSNSVFDKDFARLPIRHQMKKKGFSLIELLIVIAIIAILSGVGLASFSGTQKRGRDARRQADLESVRSALELYRADNSSTGYPNPAGIDGTNGKYSNLFSVSGFPTYITPLPQDPRNVNPFVYTYSGGGATYTLCANQLEATGVPYCVVPP